MSNASSRRQVIKAGFLAAIGASIISNAIDLSVAKDVRYVNGDSEWHSYNVGIASYSLQKMHLEEMIMALKHLNLRYI